MAKKAFVYDGTNWIDIAQSTADLSNYANLTTNQPTFRNIFINGGFAIDQRNAGASQTITAGAALAYTVDRWYAYCTGANITGARVAGTAPSQYYYRFTGAASNTAVGFAQRIEAANSFHFAGKAVTLAVNIASTSLTSITWTAYYANTADTFGTVASPTRTQIATGTFAVTSTLGRKTANITFPSAATTGIEIVFTGGALLGSQTLTFDSAQLELGSIATPFEQRPIGTELALCQRYYETSTNMNFYGYQANAGDVYRNWNIFYAVEKRIGVTPTSSGGNVTISWNGGGTRNTSGSQNIGSTAGSYYVTSWIANAEL